jgi:hypothetical protein
MMIAQQSVSQLDDQGMVNTIMDNVGTIIAFRSKSPATESLLLHQFGPYVEPGEIGNLPSFNFYARIAAIDPQEPLSGRTLLLNDYIISPNTADRIIESSRIRYAKKYKDTVKLKTNILLVAETKNTSHSKMKKPIKAIREVP